MIESEYTALVAGRLADWTGFLRERNATPILLLGLSSGPAAEIHVAVCEAVTNAEIRGMLMQALVIMQAGESSIEEGGIGSWEVGGGDRKAPAFPTPPPKSQIPNPEDSAAAAIAKMAAAMTPPQDAAPRIQDLLVALDVAVPLATIRGWTDQQRWDAEQWARRMRARRADPADVPARPEFL